MLTNLTDAQADDIAQSCDMGMIVYLHKEKGTVFSMPDFESAFADPDNMELWEDDEEYQAVQENEDDYHRFEKMSSSDSFQQMEDFARSIEDEKVTEQLFNALNRRKPFRSFKDELFNLEGDYLEDWYAYKKKSNMEWVREEFKFMINGDSWSEEE